MVIVQLITYHNRAMTMIIITAMRISRKITPTTAPIAPPELLPLLLLEPDKVRMVINEVVTFESLVPVEVLVTVGVLSTAEVLEIVEVLETVKASELYNT